MYNNKISRFILLETLLIFGFAIAYLLSDIFLYNYSELGKKLGFGSINKKVIFYHTYIFH